MSLLARVAATTEAKLGYTQQEAGYGKSGKAVRRAFTFSTMAFTEAGVSSLARVVWSMMPKQALYSSGEASSSREAAMSSKLWAMASLSGV